MNATAAPAVNDLLGNQFQFMFADIPILLPQVKAKITARRSRLLQKLEHDLELCPDVRAALDAALVDDPPQSPKEGGLIRPGFDAGLAGFAKLREPFLLYR